MEVAVDVHVQRRGDAAASGSVGNAVADVDRVGCRWQRELDVLAGRETDRRSAGGLGRERVRLRARADDGAVGDGVLGLLFNERDVGSATCGQRRVDSGAGDDGRCRGVGSTKSPQRL